jgi:hypothetical protein
MALYTLLNQNGPKSQLYRILSGVAFVTPHMYDDLLRQKPLLGISAGVRPTEAHAELIVHTDAVLTRAIAFQRFQPIARRNPQVVQSGRDLQLAQLTSRDGRDVRKPLDPFALGEGLRVGALERLDHAPIVTPYVITIKRASSRETSLRPLSLN